MITGYFLKPTCRLNEFKQYWTKGIKAYILKLVLILRVLKTPSCYKHKFVLVLDTPPDVRELRLQLSFTHRVNHWQTLIEVQNRLTDIIPVVILVIHTEAWSTRFLREVTLIKFSGGGR